MLYPQPDIETATSTQQPLLGDLSHLPLACVCLRLLYGWTILMHGVGRLISGNAHFVQSTVHSFEGTVLPSLLVNGFATCVAPVETVLGLLIMLGVAPRVVYPVTILWLANLTFGSGILQEWNAVSVQLTYGLVAFVLLVLSPWDRWRFPRPAPVPPSSR